MARKRSFQRGSLFQRGKRNKVWVARWWEETIDRQGKSIRVRRSEVLGKVADLTSQRQAAKVLTQRMQRINGDYYSPQATRKFADFVRGEWEQ